METVHRVPQPVIARVHGVATAAGCQLVAACDLAIAADDARFGTSGVKTGLFCSTPAVPVVRAIGRKRALELLLTGKLVDAPTALEWGLVNRVVPAEQLDDAVAELVEEIAALSPLAIAVGKEGFYAQVDLARARGLRGGGRDDGRERARRRRPGGDVRVRREAPAGVARALSPLAVA